MAMFFLCKLDGGCTVFICIAIFYILHIFNKSNLVCKERKEREKEERKAEGQKGREGAREKRKEVGKGTETRRKEDKMRQSLSRTLMGKSSKELTLLGVKEGTV